MTEKKFGNELRARNAAEMIGGKMTATENGYFIETTLGGLIKYNLSRGFSLNLNTHCALVALSTPMFDNELEVRIRFVEKHHLDWQVERMKREIADYMAWSLDYQLWVMDKVFGRQIRLAHEAAQAAEHAVPAVKNLLTDMPDTFTAADLKRHFIALGKKADSVGGYIRQQLHRNNLRRHGTGFMKTERFKQRYML